MPTLIFDSVPAQKVKKGMERKVIHGDNLMTVILDFVDGPWKEPDSFHSHPHEQSSYLAEGEILFICEDESPRYLKAGDAFFVPSGKMHTIQLLTEKARLIDSFTPLRKDFL